MSRDKGDRRERELVNILDDHGWAVMRSPASGSATDREQPDALAGNGRAFYAIEAKSSAGDPIYLDAAEVDALESFAAAFGATPLLAVRFDYRDWCFLAPDDCHRTPGGSYRVKKTEAPERGAVLSAWLDGHADIIAEHADRLARTLHTDRDHADPAGAGED